MTTPATPAQKLPVANQGTADGTSDHKVGPEIRPQRRILGMSAVLLPHDPSGDIDWLAFTAHLRRTLDAGLVPAVNMDTGYVQLLDQRERNQVLEVAQRLDDEFIAGAHVADRPGDPFVADAYRFEIDRIVERGGTPIVFPSHGLNALDGDAWVEAQEQITKDCDAFYSFELGRMFVPYGRIYDLEAFRGLLELDRCLGAKHSSLSRELEWQRLELRDRLRPDFRLLTGNDLAIDMVIYGSDYLLGLSTMAPDLFARRDRLWQAGDNEFYALNDLLQYLGQFTFRAPVPAYRHSAAQFLVLRGWASSDAVPATVPRRPDSDVEVLSEILARLGTEPSLIL